MTVFCVGVSSLQYQRFHLDSNFGFFFYFRTTTQSTLEDAYPGLGMRQQMESNSLFLPLITTLTQLVGCTIDRLQGIVNMQICFDSMSCQTRRFSLTALLELSTTSQVTSVTQKHSVELGYELFQLLSKRCRSIGHLSDLALFAIEFNCIFH